MSDWLNDLENILHAFTAWVRSLRLSQPQKPIFISRKEEADMWQYEFGNPPANTAPDWTARAFVATVDGVEESPVPVIPKDTTANITLTFPENADVSLICRDYDDATPTPLQRDSDPVVFSVNDDVPPDVPGAPVFVSKTEVP